MSALLDFLHTLSYKGLNIFAGFDANLPTQLWVSARFVQVAGMIVAAFLIGIIITKRIMVFTVLFNFIIFISLILAIFVFRIFPVSYIEGYGLTEFKIITEYVLSGLAFTAIVIYFFKRKKIKNSNYLLIALSLTFFILSELSFTLYVDVYGLFNMFGHIFKLISFYFIYRFFISTNLRDPFSILFGDLKRANEKLEYISSHDALTGLLNQSALFDTLKNQYNIAERFNKPFSIIMIDIDDFKNINDRYGHPAGNEALKHMAEIIKRTVREVDIKGRYGGDEFIISPLEASVDEALLIAQKLIYNLKNLPAKENKPFINFNISAGISGQKENTKFDDIIIKADKALLKSKKLGKDRITLFG